MQDTNKRMHFAPAKVDTSGRILSGTMDVAPDSPSLTPYPLSMPSPKQYKGTAGESMAARFLEEKGYVILERNYRFMKAEVDLIAFLPAADYERGGDLVFVEVKWRQNAAFALPESAVDAAKRRNLIMAAEAFLHERKMEGTPCRFDIVAIVGSGSTLEIVHLESAFVA